MGDLRPHSVVHPETSGDEDLAVGPNTSVSVSVSVSVSETDRNRSSDRPDRGLRRKVSSTQDHETDETSSEVDVSPRRLKDQTLNCNHDTTQKVGESKTSGRYFYYDSPHYEDTGVWIPVSVPPMLESAHEEWTKGFCYEGAFFPEEDLGWDHFLEDDKGMTMWDVVSEMLIAAKGKMSSMTKVDPLQYFMQSRVSIEFLEQSWKETVGTLVDASLENVKEILDTEPPKWLVDSVASACMLCNMRFHPIMCSRHHCRFCGGIFCNECSKGRSLLPPKFLKFDPQRVCDVCGVRLVAVQPHLMNQVSRASQVPTRDLTDLSTLRAWMNFPWGQSMEYEIYKASNTIRGYNKIGLVKPEKFIPEAVLRQAKGLAILSVVNIGVMVTYNVGTGLVIARREDGSWSPPSAVSTFGIGWGAQGGGQLTDLIIVLRTTDAVRTFSGNAHLSVGAGLNAAAGVVGRAVKADFHAGYNGYAACYTYSCSKGAFVGCSLEGSVVTTRASVNARFYGSSIATLDILLGSMTKPPAATILYHALSDLEKKRRKY